MPSFSHGLLKLSADNMQRVMGVDLNNIPRVRKFLTLSGPTLALPKDVETRTNTWEHLPVEWLYPVGANKEKVILYLHGGGYSVGSIQTHRGLAARLAQWANTTAVVIDYRLAPEHPFPAALEDAVLAYQMLLAKGYDPGHIAIAGDSAGGGLAIATLLALRDMKHLPMPGCTLCFSPWVDLSFCGESAKTNAEFDPIVRIKEVSNWGYDYAGEYEINNPLISPLNGDLSDLPSIMIQASDKEVLTSDATRLAEKLEAVGNDVHLQLWPELLHVWQLFWRMVPEADDALKAAGAFIDAHTHLPHEVRKMEREKKV